MRVTRLAFESDPGYDAYTLDPVSVGVASVVASGVPECGTPGGPPVTARFEFVVEAGS